MKSTSDIMENASNSKKTTENPLKKLKSYLEEEFKPSPKDTRPPMMEWNEMENFFNQKILPVFKKIKKELSEYKFENLTYETHTRVAILKIVSALYLFHFKVDIDNSNRQIVIFYRLRYRTHRKKKLNEIKNLETHQVAFTDIDTINDNMLLDLFAKWFMSKDEMIQKDKEWLANNKE